MGNKPGVYDYVLENWGERRKEAFRGYDRASSSYLHKKAPSEKLADELRRTKVMSKLPWYDRWSIKHRAMESKINRHVNALLSEMGASAARLAPESKWGVFLELGSLGVGAAAGASLKIAGLTKLRHLHGGIEVMAKGPKGIKGISHEINVAREAVRQHRMSKGMLNMVKELGKVTPGSAEAVKTIKKSHRTRAILRGVWFVDKAVDGAHAAHMAGKSVKHIATNIPYKEQTKTSLKPRTPFSQHPWSQIPVPAKQKPIKKLIPRRQRGPSYSFLDQAKVADWMLQQSMHKPVKPTSRPYDPFMTTTNRLKGIEKSAQARLAEERRIKTLLNRFGSSISKPQPFNAHEQMRQKYGAKIDTIAKMTPKFTPGSAHMSPQDWMSLQKKLGIGQTSRSPFTKSPHPTTMPVCGPRPRPLASGSVGYMGQNSLRAIATPLVNPNRSRPMMKPMFR